MNGTPLLDAAILDDLIEHIGQDAVRAILELFIGECRELVAQMETAAANPDAARRAAHSLKSSAGQLGAAALSEAAIAVEAAPPADMRALIAALADCATRTEATLSARLAG